VTETLELLEERTREARPRYIECLNAALDYWHECLHDEIPLWSGYSGQTQYSTAYEYLEERTINDDVIERFKLGWAPGGDDKNLYEHLSAHFTDQEIRESGVMRDDLGWVDGFTATVEGRVVMPYGFENGYAHYFISRGTGAVVVNDEGSLEYVGGHPDDWMSSGTVRSKYAKAYTKGESKLGNRLMGVQSVRDDAPLVITEGYMDALNCIGAGYSALSPVTTSFSSDQADDAAAHAARASHVYIINDNEESGVGQSGAASVASSLVFNHGIENVDICLPPRDDEAKVDLDDYILAGGDVSDLFESPLDIELEEPSADSDDGPTFNPDHTEAQSDLWDLRLTDVAPVSAGERTKNPIQHIGNSENYFVVSEDGETATDFKGASGGGEGKITYNASTYLLCAEGVRPAREPEGSLSPEEKYELWTRALDRGYISEVEIPSDALRFVALSEGLCEPSDIVDGWKLPSDAYNAALGIVEDWGYDPVRKPLAQRARLETCDSPHYDPRPFDINEVRRELREEKLDDFLSNDRDIIWNHPPGIGKTTNAMLGLLDRDVAHSVLFDTHQKIDEMMEECIEHNGDEICFGDHYFHLLGGEQLRERQCRAYERADESCPHHSECPRMCSAYDGDEFNRVMQEVGPVQAHLILEPHGEDRCEWLRRLSEAQSEEHILGVKGHQLLSTIQNKEVVIYDEAPQLPTEETSYSVGDIENMANQLAELSDTTHGRLSEYAGAFSEFATQVVDDLLDRRDEPPSFPEMEEPPGVLGLEPLVNELTDLVKIKQAFNVRIIDSMGDGE
jgi:hypothetical protein